MTRRVVIWVLSGLVLLGGGATRAAVAAEPAPAYASLPGAKALALVPSRPEVRALVQGQPHDLAASVTARERCQAMAAPGETCEIVFLNDEHVTTGREILERVPSAPHPLFLWRYRRGPTELYLAGSIHVLKPSLYPLPRQLDTAFDRADHLVLEVNMADIDPAELQRRTLSYALLAPPQTLRTVIPPDLYARLGEHLADYGSGPEMLDAAKPAMVMNQVVILRLLALGYLPDSGLESHFLARRTHQDVLELESLDAQLDLLFNQPLDTQVVLLRETLDMEAQIEPLLSGMLVAWLSGDDAGFLEEFTAQSGDSPEAQAFSRKLLDERNAVMADRIEGLLDAAPGGHYFVLVGAAHLVGDDGIVNLLARRGTMGRRIQSTERIAGESNPQGARP